ncbi:MAG: hypothetical protein OEV78_05045 [Spirochaetia bacterium]|nr:hypothetical protein [Spirochaetia bacterium]
MRIKYKKIYDLISSLSKEAYKDKLLIANEFLSKNTFTSEIFEIFDLQDKVINTYLTLIMKIRLLSIYYVKITIYFLLYLFSYLIYKSIIPSLDKKKIINEKLYLIHNYFALNRIQKSHEYEDHYFPDLFKYISEKNEVYYTPMFYGTHRFPFLITQIVLFLKKQEKPQKVPMITEFDLLSLSDVIFALLDSYRYPAHLIKFITGRSEKIIPIILLKEYLKIPKSIGVFDRYIQYRFGHRISLLSKQQTNILMWYENNTIDKSFIRGIKDGDSKRKVNITGLQLYIYSDSEIHYYPDSAELFANVLPDRILVNGPMYMANIKKISCSVGPSLRYKRIFSFKTKRSDQKNYLVLLPYLNLYIEQVLELIQPLLSTTQKKIIKIKFHPATDIKRFQDKLPSDIQFANEDLYEEFKTTKLVIGMSTGALLESVALGIPAIQIFDDSKTYQHDILIDAGKGLIWENAKNSMELMGAIKRLEYNFIKRRNEINKCTKYYRENYFSQPDAKKMEKIDGVWL